MPELRSWIGRSRTVEDDISLSAVRRIAGMLDQDPDSYRRGSPLPPHWFSLFFADVARQSAIGPDGHPRKGEFLPPIPLPRRMGAGRRTRIHGVLHVGDEALNHHLGVSCFADHAVVSRRSCVKIEAELSQAVNALGIGPQGLGGRSTAFAVHVEVAATHITQNPVAVNIQCHSARRARATITPGGIAFS